MNVTRTHVHFNLLYDLAVNYYYCVDFWVVFHWTWTMANYGV